MQETWCFLVSGLAGKQPKDRRSLSCLLGSSVIKHRVRSKHEFSVTDIFSNQWSYVLLLALILWRAIPLLLYDHDVHLYTWSCLMIQSSCFLKFLSGSFLSVNKCQMFPCLGLSAASESQEKKGCGMFLPKEFSHWLFCLVRSCWDISTLAGLANSRMPWSEPTSWYKMSHQHGVEGTDLDYMEISAKIHLLSVLTIFWLSLLF